jgi:AcrR family transcriptional regulator
LNTFRFRGYTPAVPTERVQDGPRGAATRQLILDSALRLFRERSYEGTTMRAVATAAGVSVGNAYYYFSGKDELVQAFYAGIQDEHRRRVAAAPPAPGFAGQLRSVLHAGLDVMAPHHEFAAAFVRIAIDPRSAASPFSAESTGSRDAAVGLFRDVAGQAGRSLDPGLRAALPELLWLTYLGVTLFWVHDGSPGQVRTRELVDRICPLVDRLLRMSRLPGVRSVVADVVALVGSVR